MEYSSYINTLKSEIISNIMGNLLPVKEIFEDYFTSEYVDLQIDKSELETHIEKILKSKTDIVLSIEETTTLKSNTQKAVEDLNLPCNILVWFPEKIITNEKGESHTLLDLYVKIPLKHTGKMISGFYMNRATYTINEVNADYMHSHVPGIPKSDFSIFSTPCHGSGPISTTCYTLGRDCDLDIWKLFCLELDRYVGVESKRGGPYRHMSDIATQNYQQNILTDFTLNLEGSGQYAHYFLPLISEILKRKLIKFAFDGKKYILGEDIQSITIKVTNLFKEMICFNEDYIKKIFFDPSSSCHNALTRSHPIFGRSGVNSRFVVKAIFRNLKIIILKERNNDHIDLQNISDKFICIFKDRVIKTTILGYSNKEDESPMYILNPKIISQIILYLLNLINAGYAKQSNTTYIQRGTNRGIPQITTVKETSIIHSLYTI